MSMSMSVSVSVSASKSQIISDILGLTESERNVFAMILKNKNTLGFLEREAEWMSTHEYGPHYGPNACNSHYSGDTECEHTGSLKQLVLTLFDQPEYETRIQQLAEAGHHGK